MRKKQHPLVTEHRIAARYISPSYWITNMFSVGIISFIITMLLDKGSRPNIHETMQDIVTIGLAPAMFVAMIFIRVPKVEVQERDMLVSWTWVVRAFSVFGNVVGVLLGWTFGASPSIPVAELLAYIHIALCGCLLIVVSGTLIGFKNTYESFETFYKTVDDGNKSLAEVGIFVGYLQVTAFTILALIVISLPIEIFSALGYKSNLNIEALRIIYLLAISAAIVFCNPPVLSIAQYESSQRKYKMALESYLVMGFALAAIHFIFDSSRWIGYSAVVLALIYSKRQVIRSINQKS